MHPEGIYSHLAFCSEVWETVCIAMPVSNSNQLLGVLFRIRLWKSTPGSELLPLLSVSLHKIDNHFFFLEF